jgi:hypothetical protein
LQDKNKCLEENLITTLALIQRSDNKGDYEEALARYKQRIDLRKSKLEMELQLKTNKGENIRSIQEELNVVNMIINHTRDISGVIHGVTTTLNTQAVTRSPGSSNKVNVNTATRANIKKLAVSPRKSKLPAPETVQVNNISKTVTDSLELSSVPTVNSNTNSNLEVD